METQRTNTDVRTLPTVGSKVEVKDIGTVYCSRAENGTMAFLGTNSDGTISRYEVYKNDIKAKGDGGYVFDKLKEQRRLNRDDGDFVRLARKLKSAKMLETY